MDESTPTQQRSRRRLFGRSKKIATPPREPLMSAPPVLDQIPGLDQVVKDHIVPEIVPAPDLPGTDRVEFAASVAPVAEINRLQTNAPDIADTETDPAPDVDEVTPAPAPDMERRLIVGRDVHFASTVTGCDLINIFGHVEGEFEAARLMIAEGGVFSGRAKVETAEIRGRADGTINVAGTLRLCAGARIDGRISYGNLEIEAGAVIEGAVEQSAS